MADINETQVIIAGKVLTLTGYETAEYTQKVANYINRKMDECRNAVSFRSQNKEMQMLLVALNIADDYMKIVEKLAENEQIIKDKDTEIYNLKHDIITTQGRLDKADEQIRTLQDKMAESAKKLMQMDAKVRNKSKNESKQESRSEAVKAEETKAPEKSEPVKPEAPKAEAVKAPEKPESVKAEAPKADVPKAPEKPEPAKSEAPKAEAPKAPEKPEPSKTEVPKAEASKAPEKPEPAKPEAAKTHEKPEPVKEANKAEDNKPSDKTEDSKTDETKSDDSKASDKPESSKPETSASDVPLPVNKPAGSDTGTIPFPFGRK